MTNFPLTTEYLPGLKMLGPIGGGVVYLRDLEAELAKGVQMKHYPDQFGWFTTNFLSPTNMPNREALLIGDRPVEPESAEDLLREIVENRDFSYREQFDAFHAAVTKARAYLQRRGEK